MIRTQDETLCPAIQHDDLLRHYVESAPQTVLALGAGIAFWWAASRVMPHVERRLHVVGEEP